MRGMIRRRVTDSYCVSVSGRTVLAIAGSHSCSRYSRSVTFDGCTYDPSPRPVRTSVRAACASLLVANPPFHR
jgi:hypothetical protein